MKGSERQSRGWRDEPVAVIFLVIVAIWIVAQF